MPILEVNPDGYMISNRCTVGVPRFPYSANVAHGPENTEPDDPRVNEDLFSYCDCSGV